MGTAWPLAGLASLEVLYLENTPLSDVTPLMQLTRLNKLYLDDTQVAQEQFDVLRGALPNCKIYWVP